MWGPERKHALGQPGDIGKFTHKGIFEGDTEGWVCKRRDQVIPDREESIRKRVGHRKCGCLKEWPGYSFCPLLMPMSEAFSISFIL